MKLRHRVAIVFALVSSASLVASRLVTLESFRRLQEYELDRGLLDRAQKESSEVALVGRKALEAEYDAQEETNPLEQLVTYGALYRADGTVVADTASFEHAPSLRDIGVDPSRPPSGPFDFVFRGHLLRGALADIRPSSIEGRFLLVAASRRDMDDDARQLLAVGWWVALAWIPVTLAIGWWFGRRMTYRIERLAEAAGRVSVDAVHMPDLEPTTRAGDEVTVLARTLREMVGRLDSHIQRERRFAAHAAHELRSPLAALRGELELALHRRRSPEDYEAALTAALEDTDRLVELAEDLLVVARLGNGPEERAATCVVADVLDEALAASRAGEGFTLERHGETELTVRGDPSALVRMLRNLIDNAVTHGHGRAVRVSVAAREVDDIREVQLTVEDEGPGVADEDQGRLFDHFHRGASARQDSGAGLGLGIAREIARQHGGDIVLASARAPTRFVITLPAASAPLTRPRA